MGTFRVENGVGIKIIQYVCICKLFTLHVCVTSREKHCLCIEPTMHLAFG